MDEIVLFKLRFFTFHTRKVKDMKWTKLLTRCNTMTLQFIIPFEIFMLYSHGNRFSCSAEEIKEKRAKYNSHTEFLGKCLNNSIIILNVGEAELGVESKR